MVLDELISPRKYLFLWGMKRLILVFEREFPRHRPFCPVVFVFAQRRKLDRMNYHETWRIVRAWKPPLNEGNPRNGVTTVSDNNNVSLKAENDGGGGEGMSTISGYLLFSHSLISLYFILFTILLFRGEIFALSVEATTAKARTDLTKRTLIAY